MVDAGDMDQAAEREVRGIGQPGLAEAHPAAPSERIKGRAARAALNRPRKTLRDKQPVGDEVLVPRVHDRVYGLAKQVSFHAEKGGRGHGCGWSLLFPGEALGWGLAGPPAPEQSGEPRTQREYRTGFRHGCEENVGPWNANPATALGNENRVII